MCYSTRKESVPLTHSRMHIILDPTHKSKVLLFSIHTRLGIRSSTIIGDPTFPVQPFKMKITFLAASIFAALLLLAAPTSASRRLLQDSTPSAADVAASIDQWGQDVDQVNNFLNQAASLPDPAGAAANTKQTALNEPVQLGILSSVPGLSDKAKSAVLLLQEVFGNVPTDLQSIVDDPSPSNVHTQLNSINNVRCFNVLPSLDILWPAAAEAVGLDVSYVPPVPRPTACASM